jgi:hypothetical protein
LTKFIFDEKGLTLIRKEEAEPKCGEDFCDTCGDCLYCFSEDSCINKSTHQWIQYGEK